MFKGGTGKSMSQEKNNWQELDQEYFELWDWILKECDGDWTKTYQGQSSQEAEEYRTKLNRFGEICRLIAEREQPYYFCWLKTKYERSWTRGRVPAAHPNYENRFRDSETFPDSKEGIFYGFPLQPTAQTRQLFIEQFHYVEPVEDMNRLR